VSELAPLTVSLLTAEFIERAVDIHLRGMGETLNARLGPEHLQYLYMLMMEDASCYAAVAVVDGRPLGVITGSLNARRFEANALAKMSIARLARTAAKILSNPGNMALWLKGNQIAKPVRTATGEVVAVLTAIVVEPATQGRGVGRALVAAFETFLRGQGAQTYRLDTQIGNIQAVEFYRSLGFSEATRRADSIIFVKTLQP